MTPAGKFWVGVLAVYFLIAFIWLFDADAAEEQVCEIVTLKVLETTGETGIYDIQQCWDVEIQDWVVTWILKVDRVVRRD